MKNIGMDGVWSNKDFKNLIFRQSPTKLSQNILLNECRFYRLLRQNCILVFPLFVRKKLTSLRKCVEKKKVSDGPLNAENETFRAIAGGSRYIVVLELAMQTKETALYKL